MNPPEIADYTSRKSYQQNYAKENREAINARKRAWRLARKFDKPKTVFSDGTDAEK